jgi:NAD(P)-dependent dehydrogenase (short-subunit alcohol dehydrogenase family)
MHKTIAVLGAGRGLGLATARRFGREGFRVALAARTADRLDSLVGVLRTEGIEAAGFCADLADRPAVPLLLDEISARFGSLDVVEYAPSGLVWLQLASEVLNADVDAFEYPLDLLLRTPVVLARHLLPGMIDRRAGALLFGLAVTASAPYPQIANVGTAAAAARAYLHNLSVALAPTGVYVGLLQVAGMVAGSESAEHFERTRGPGQLPAPLDPRVLADAYWSLYNRRDRFEETIGPAGH